MRSRAKGIEALAKSLGIGRGALRIDEVRDDRIKERTLSMVGREGATPRSSGGGGSKHLAGPQGDPPRRARASRGFKEMARSRVKERCLFAVSRYDDVTRASTNRASAAKSASPRAHVLRAPEVLAMVATGHVVATAEQVSEALAILVVDDDDAVRGVVVRVLRRLGHAVEACASAREAEASTYGYNMAMVDLNLGAGQENGYDLLERLRERKPEASYVLTSGSKPTLPGPDRGGPLFLQKPFSRGDLVELLARVSEELEKRRG